MNRKTHLKSYVLATASAAVMATAFTAFAAPAMAQGAAEAAPDRVVVTGSRIQRSSDFTSQTPTTVLGAQELDNLGIVNAGDAVLQIPSNISTFSPSTTGNSAFFAGSVIPNLRGLNPFFGSRTLTLVDTRRHVQTNQGDGVDLNFIPSILIDRIETVTGGASAAYGSGAVSGVTNILLNRTLNGGKYELDYGVSGQGDGDDLHAAAAYGASVLNGRGHLVVGGEYQDAEAIGCFDARDYCGRNIGFLSNGVAFGTGAVPYTPAVPGQPNNILAGDLRANQVSMNGVLVGSGLQANAAGTGTEGFAMGGPDAVRSYSGTVIGGDGLPIYAFTNLRSPVTRYVGNALFNYELNPGLSLFLEGSYGDVETTNAGQGSVYSGIGFLGINNGLIATDNYYVQQSPELAAAVASSIANQAAFPVFSPLAPAGVEYARFGKDFTEQVGSSDTSFDTEVWRIAGGLEGDLNLGMLQGWGWDVYATHGETKRVQYLENLASNYRLALAADVVADAAGNPVCRVTRDGLFGGLSPSVASGFTSVIPELAIGCQPLNLFGTGALNPAGVDYAFGALREDLTYEQSVFAANTNGDLFDGFGAGPVQLALGAEYRTEEGANIAGLGLTNGAGTAGGALVTDAERADFPIQYGESFSGTVDVYEAYGELNVPLLAGRPGFELLEVNGAVRQSRYENESTTAFSLGATSKHDITAWKVSGTWDPIEQFRFRGSLSRDVRVPNFRELYYRQIVPAGGIFGAVTNPNLPDLFPGSQSDSSILDLQGNVAVAPEKADTWTAGFVWSPSGFGLQGFQFAADYYDIDIKDRITPAAIQRTMDGCFTANDPDFCAMIFDAADRPLTDPAADPTDISRVVAGSYNSAGYKTTGVDLTASYFTDLGDDSTLSVRILASRVIDQFFDDGAGNAFDYSGATGGGGFLPDFQSAPDWQGNATISYSRGPVTITPQIRYVGAAKINYQGLDPSDAGYDPNLTSTYQENKIEDYMLFNLNASYAFEDVGFNGNSLTVWGSVNNVFDDAPPLFGGAIAGTNPQFYDTIGRYFRVGVRGAF